MPTTTTFGLSCAKRSNHGNVSLHGWQYLAKNFTTVILPRPSALSKAPPPTVRRLNSGSGFVSAPLGDSGCRADAGIVAPHPSAPAAQTTAIPTQPNQR